MDNINQLVSINLKRLREQKGLSLDGVAKLTGVSKSMLGQIERQETNPSISTVWKIANGIKVSFSDLLNKPESGFEVIDIENIVPLLEDQGRYRNYPIFMFEPTRHFEMMYIELDPNSFMHAQPHPSGSQEYITVFSGEVIIQVNDKTYTVKDRCSVRFNADQPHEYRNNSNQLCRLSMVIYYST